MSSVGDPTNLDTAAVPEASLDQILDAWAAEAGQGDNEQRQEAVTRTRAWVEAGDVDALLDLSPLFLTSLPALPAELQVLNVNNNDLTSLPASLPAGLRRLDANHNQLTSLPEQLPAGLQWLYANGNRLTSLPERLSAGLQRLYADRNQLTSLPASLPAGLQALYVSGNQLTSLPASLPAGLQALYANGNQLTSLPASLPARLQALYANGNQLTSLPASLPARLRRLDANGNRLTSLPEHLPAELQWLDVCNNRLTSLPETLLTQLNSECRVFLDANPLPERVRRNVATALYAADYPGPQVFFSMDEEAEQGPLRPLHEAVADWLVDDPQGGRAWQGFAGEEGAQEYARFLDRLRHTVSFGNAEFRQAVVEDLRQAAARPRLRELYFALAFRASETCQDRITLTWNSMQTARLVADVEDGAYDRRLDELVGQARVMFRLDALERIARKKVSTLRFVDEIEVYLAYQVKLRERLEMPLIAPDMRFFGVSWVTEDDLTAAEEQVRQEEAAGFAAYLATKWEPWEKVVSRIAPEAYGAMQDRLIAAMGDEFRSSLDQRLAAENLTGNDDAEREFGKLVSDELASKIKGELMRQVLQEEGLEL
ncbi:NEL-type E3 ubiquitin ligase domain-containing protein [Mesorhizobium silamurunense]|uniref:NEL-type E3 ubiquitin ligase domain-containing protein n=2 Tax=Mesorhizobium silamurunense TaxID=499528 RepID=UPI0028A79A49|nr:NEL-type E3 ubiquitin ligase domain-containing protein [Mesorhizobium silamurunense]